MNVKTEKENMCFLTFCNPNYPFKEVGCIG